MTMTGYRLLLPSPRPLLRASCLIARMMVCPHSSPRIERIERIERTVVWEAVNQLRLRGRSLPASYPSFVCFCVCVCFALSAILWCAFICVFCLLVFTIFYVTLQRSYFLFISSVPVYIHTSLLIPDFPSFLTVTLFIKPLCSLDRCTVPWTFPSHRSYVLINHNNISMNVLTYTYTYAYTCI